MRQWLLVLVLVACGGKTDSDDLGSDQVVSGDDTGQSSGGDSGAPAGGPIEVTVDRDCEPLAEGACMLPWPSDRYLKSASTETGHRINYIQDVMW